MSDMPVVNNVIRWLECRSDLLLLAHERPDGDALGSLIGLHLALQSVGKNCTSYLREPLPRRYARLLPLPEGLHSGSLPSHWQESFDGVVCLDGTGWDRLDLPLGLEPQKVGIPACVIDHHPDNQRFGDLSWVEPTSAATAQMLIELLRSWGVGVDSQVASCLLCGLITDTGGFRFANVTAAVLRDAAGLIDSGADCHALMKGLFMREPYGRRLLEAKIVEQACFAHSGRLVFSVLTDAMMAETGVEPADTEGLIDVLKSVDGVEIACLLQPGPDHVRLSLRSMNPAQPVDDIAHAFGGGGHRLAAGARVAGGTLAQVEARLLELTQRVLDHGG